MIVVPKRRTFKDPWSASTHFAGFLAAIGGAVALAIHARPDATRLTGAIIYGAFLLGLFLASSLYHFFDLGVRVNHWLRRIDHAAIFLFIAACYVPATLVLLSGASRVALLAVAGTLGIGGALYKLLWFKAPLWAEMVAYLGLGWLATLLIPAVYSALPGWALAWFIGGGLFYTVGAVVYIVERPNPWRSFGHHEIWHLFVLGGAVSHYIFTWGVFDLSAAG